MKKKIYSFIDQANANADVLSDGNRSKTWSELLTANFLFQVIRNRTNPIETQQDME